ncbi:MAG TPA: hypothetical protein VIJ67_12245 [Pseudolabrys sp.]
MLTARLLLAALIALATALLPIGCNAAQPSDPVASVAMHAGKSMPCCPPEHTKSAPVFCALQCGSVIVAGAPIVAWQPFHAVKAVVTARRDEPLVGQIIQPPMHPPRA